MERGGEHLVVPSGHLLAKRNQNPAVRGTLTRKLSMTRYLAVAAVAVLMSVAPALAADEATPPSGGGADTSTGAKEQSSAPAGSEAEKDMSSGSAAGQSTDTSSGAKEQSSAPPGSSAADKKPNPTTDPN